MNKGKEELEKMAELKQRTTGDPNAVIYSWDKSFYNNLMKEGNEYDVDEEKIKEYFPT